MHLEVRLCMKQKRAASIVAVSLFISVNPVPGCGLFRPAEGKTLAGPQFNLPEKNKKQVSLVLFALRVTSASQDAIRCLTLIPPLPGQCIPRVRTNGRGLSWSEGEYAKRGL